MLIAISCSDKNVQTPILILATDSGYGTYTAEILKAEGFNEFSLDSLSDKKVTAGYLKEFDLVIITETPIDEAARTMLTDYVSRGGNLIAFCPDPEIAGLFGITPDGRYIKEGYISIKTDSEFGRGLSEKALRIHGAADICALAGGSQIAALSSGKSTGESYPAIVSNLFKKGQAIAFLYNLPKSVVYSRQGNPLYAGLEKDGIPGLRGMDMFTDGWVDTENSTINQADEQITLLSHCIEKMTNSVKPLPRFWYFPDTLKCIVTLTNDGEYKGENDFEAQFRDVDSMGAKMSIYILEVDKVSKAWADKWRSRGFEISGHPDDTWEAVDPHWKNMDSVLAAKQAQITGKFGVPMRTNVNHWFVWCGTDADGQQDFGAEAILEAKHGLGMDLNYAHYDIKSNQGDQYLGPHGTNQGNFTGSGLVMKFADARGKVIDVYQQLTPIYDQEYTESHDPEGFFNAFKGLMDRSLHDGVYSFISVKAHNDEYYFSKAPLMKMLAYSSSNGIPVWTALNLLDFVKMKDQATFTEIRWSGNILNFIINSSLKHGSGLSFMVPLEFNKKKIEGITSNGRALPFIINNVKGSAYALATVSPGEDHSIIVKYRN